MIRIKRSSCPAVLRGAAADSAAADSDRYRHPDVVRELWEMQREKCCYCERKIPDTGHAKAVEHFAPKSVFKARRNHWSNLLLACSQCNGKKGSKFPVMLTENAHEEKILYVKKAGKNPPALIDPSGKINPEAHLDYRVDSCSSSGSSNICESTRFTAPARTPSRRRSGSLSRFTCSSPSSGNGSGWKRVFTRFYRFSALRNSKKCPFYRHSSHPTPQTNPPMTPTN